MQDRMGMAVLLITHDLGVVAETADRVVVLYAGRMAETASTEALFQEPRHPYTAGLLASLPEMAPPGSRLSTIEGMVPSPLDFPTGCRFRTRCDRATGACTDEPQPTPVGPGHVVWCHHPFGSEGS